MVIDLQNLHCAHHTMVTMKMLMRMINGIAGGGNDAETAAGKTAFGRQPYTVV